MRRGGKWANENCTNLAFIRQRGRGNHTTAIWPVFRCIRLDKAIDTPDHMGKHYAFHLRNTLDEKVLAQAVDCHATFITMLRIVIRPTQTNTLGVSALL